MTAKIAKLGIRIYEIPSFLLWKNISTRERIYWIDGVWAIIYILIQNLS